MLLVASSRSSNNERHELTMRRHSLRVGAEDNLHLEKQMSPDARARVGRCCRGCRGRGAASFAGRHCFRRCPGQLQRVNTTRRIYPGPPPHHADPVSVPRRATSHILISALFSSIRFRTSCSLSQAPHSRRHRRHGRNSGVGAALRDPLVYVEARIVHDMF
jgi:hypothetical protein